MCDSNTRELEADFAILRDRQEEQEKLYQRNLWMLLISSGGIIRVPPNVQRDVEDPGGISVARDKATGDLVFTAALYTEGISEKVL